MRIAVVSLFPRMILDALSHGVVGRALSRGTLRVDCFDPRDGATDVHRTVDDRPFGGGPGMVLKVEPLRSVLRGAVASFPEAVPRVVLGADGRRFDQDLARIASTWPGLVLIAGRYEGIDERLLESEADERWSIGDYVLSGGELPALVVIDTIARLLPGTLGDAESAEQESFSDGLLDWPHYTRPAEIDGRRVPEVLMSGDHAAIRRWRLREALGRTWLWRPDLLERRGMNAAERELLEEFKAERGERRSQ
ncbi:MAG: tRNA (guanosine(37)-N1)-methyltransferase TrmD [Gammaproteobacteria bacterium]|nr:tRNA (guanosine(37)-N1)-methyltransferase TrmD [Gammaproteobacteria bacterium]MDE2347210.1 tRNA (guanosine(37)-N1)-methyltransferase TrmD [Gammaproteobacteria bacterium]